YQWLSMPYVSTERLNGTGDVFSAVITAEIAKGNDLFTAAEIAKNVVYDSISKPIIVGHRHGPINLWNAHSK
ncbi:bifunctional hydroxymethylpyrimidine kinase/phosphomethylpyrimidine kinase, partial [Limosilactobacillus oris]